MWHFRSSLPFYFFSNRSRVIAYPSVILAVHGYDRFSEHDVVWSVIRRIKEPFEWIMTKRTEVNGYIKSNEIFLRKLTSMVIFNLVRARFAILRLIDEKIRWHRKNNGQWFSNRTYLNRCIVLHFCGHLLVANISTPWWKF